VARAFTDAKVLPVASQHDREETFPSEVIAAARDLGLVDVTIPAELGGGGLGILEAVIVSEEIARGCSGIASALTLNSVTADAVLVAGTPEQQADYLGRITAGGFGSYALTEPGAGSDVAAIEARAERQDHGYILNGSKVWITNATVAGFFVVFAKTAAGGREAISAFLVDRDAQGVAVGEKLHKLGQRAAPAAEVFLDDVAVPESARLGTDGSGFETAMRVFDRSRPVIAALALGILQRCLDESVAHATTRRTMGKPIIRHQAIGHKIADIAIRLEAARALTYKAAWLLDQGRPNTYEAAAAKAFAADSAMWAAVEAVQILGGMGYSDEFPVEKLMRDAKVIQIYEGTSEIQRNIIVRSLSG
jgi:acyl-CoA dehydrogenase